MNKALPDLLARRLSLLYFYSPFLMCCLREFLSQLAQAVHQFYKSNTDCVPQCLRLYDLSYCGFFLRYGGFDVIFEEISLVGEPELYGRHEIYVSKTADQINAGNIAEILSEIMTVHKQNAAECDYLYKYAKGRQPIKVREKKIRPEVKNIITENHALEILTFKVGYTFGEPVQFVLYGDCDIHDPEKENDTRITAFNELLRADNKISKDKTLGNWIYTCGVGYRLCLPSEENADHPFDTFILDPRTAFVAKLDNYTKKPVVCGFHNRSGSQFDVYTTKKHFYISYAVTEEGTVDYEKAPTIEEYPNPMGSYGCSFAGWIASNNPRPYNSFGNGAGMRVSPCGYIARTLDEALDLAKQSAEVTHNHPEGIKGAQAIAAAIFLARQHTPTEDIRRYIEHTFGYNLQRTCDDIRPTYEFDETCQGSCPEAIIAFLDSTDYESAIRLAISLGGDSDTIACMTGGIAAAYYGIPDWMVEKAVKYLPADMIDIINRFDGRDLKK